MKNKKMRYFEVAMFNGSVGILSEEEIEKYKEKVQEVRSEFTKKEIEKIKPSPLNKEDKKVLGIN